MRISLLSYVIILNPFLAKLGLAVLGLLLMACQSDSTGGNPKPSQPNIVLILADDLGYGDLGVYGSETSTTPNLDRLATEGIRFTEFYSGNPVCSPSRAVLLTGRYAARQELKGTWRGVYFPLSDQGMDPNQVTLAEVLNEAGYATALVGKWHLGHKSEFLPTSQGFENFYGLPYSNDMNPLPWMENQIQMEDVANPEALSELTERYLEKAVEFMVQSHQEGKPFFLYHPTHLPHIPLNPSVSFHGLSPSCEEVAKEQACGLYADTIAELDWSVGEILNTLEVLGIEEETVVIFTSDNGPWLSAKRDGGSTGGLRGGKGTTFEGGLRVPAIIRWTGRLPASRVIYEPAALFDLFPTLAGYAGAQVPEDLEIDGRDLDSLLRGEDDRDPNSEIFSMLYYRPDGQTPGAYREGRWKYKAEVTTPESEFTPELHNEFLFDLQSDSREATNLALEYPNLLSELKERMADLDSLLKADPLR